MRPMVTALGCHSCSASEVASVRGPLPVITGLAPRILQTFGRDIRTLCRLEQEYNTQLDTHLIPIYNSANLC